MKRLQQRQAASIIQGHRQQKSPDRQVDQGQIARSFRNLPWRRLTGARILHEFFLFFREIW
jgi:hypothetical protein